MLFAAFKHFHKCLWAGAFIYFALSRIGLRSLCIGRVLSMHIASRFLCIALRFLCIALRLLALPLPHRPARWRAATPVLLQNFPGWGTIRAPGLAHFSAFSEFSRILVSFHGSSRDCGSGFGSVCRWVS